MNKILVTASLALLMGTASAASAATPKTLHSFCTRTDCTDGSKPWAAPVTDGAGHWFGTTAYGGAASGEGTVYEMSFDGTKWTYQRLHAFCTKSGCPDGGRPNGSLIVDTDGNLYGLAQEGGASNDGTAFELSPDGMGGWSFKVLHDFCARPMCADGHRPGYTALSYQGQASGMLYDGTSTLYGTTLNGGTKNQGVVFTLTPGMTRWTEKVIHNFCAQPSCADGGQSYTPVTVDAMGNLFGVTSTGGAYNHGVVFQLTKKTGGWKETVLHAFCAGGGFCADGDDPLSPVVLDAMGNLVGTTYFGGAHGKGSVYRLAPDGARSTLTTLYSFCATTGCPDGAHPQSAPVLDMKGHFVGTTYDGGAHNMGAIYKLAGPNHDQFTPLYAFGGGSDGQYSVSSLSLDSSGALFGTAILGGTAALGVVFEIGQ